MAKVVGLMGAASGKIGNVVYVVTNGIQTARVYQPVVQNPKSPMQNAQRAKANLAGRISSFTPRTAIMGMGINNRARRGAFLSNLLKKAEVTLNQNEYKAKVPNGDVVFSRGNVLLSLVEPTATAAANIITLTASGVSATAMSESDYNAMQTRIVVMVYDYKSQELIEVVTKIATKPGQGSQANTVILTAHPRGYFADIYAIPMSTADGSSVSINSSLATRDDTDIAAALSVNDNAVVFDYGKSVLLTSVSFNPTSSKEKN